MSNAVVCAFCSREYDAHTEDAEDGRAFVAKHGGAIVVAPNGTRMCASCVRAYHHMNAVATTMATGSDTPDSLGVRMTQLAIRVMDLMDSADDGELSDDELDLVEACADAVRAVVRAERALDAAGLAVGLHGYEVVPRD